jgi:ABC-type antimicrobial peptide transport system permease subunit
VIFGALTLVLSTIGLYTALALAVGQRTREIAIRMALGAARMDVGRLVLQRGAAIVLVGAVAGLVALVAVWLPARRAMRMDPIAALRAE